MSYLVIVSLLWAFSFGLIGSTLAGLDPWFLALARLAIALLVFLPFLRTARLSAGERFRLAMIGAVQYGLMYALLFTAFRFIQSHEVALFTIFTPIYVTLINDLGRRRFHARNFWAALLALLGAGIVTYDPIGGIGLLSGFCIMQASNICFAAGQIWYREAMRRLPGRRDASVFGLLYLGASLTALLFMLCFGDRGAHALDPREAGVLVYLGIFASGLGFFLWNKGARRVKAGTLAVFNNLKIPLAVLVSVAIFGERSEPLRLALGLIIVLGALLLNERGTRR
jgi:drug/metabolite transporter (DMT)-like permease